MEREQWVKLAETEVIKNNSNPNFELAITLPYSFEKKQDLMFEMLDADSGSSGLIGLHVTTMGIIMGAEK